VDEGYRRKLSTLRKACLTTASSTKQVRAVNVSFDSCYLLTHIKLGSYCVIKSLDK
jgi:hypothetical protein